MARRYANSWSRAAARLTGVAHTQAPIFRWGVLIALVAVWIGLGLVFWLHLGVWEALYRTIERNRPLLSKLTGFMSTDIKE